MAEKAWQEEDRLSLNLFSFRNQSFCEIAIEIEALNGSSCRNGVSDKFWLNKL